MPRWLSRDPDARVDGDGAVGECEHRVQVELRHLGQVVGEACEPDEEVDEGVLVSRWCAAEPGDEPARLSRPDELACVERR